MRSRLERTAGKPERERLIAAVKAAREAAGLSQREVSRRLGMHPLTMSRFERGERLLDVVELIELADVLGVDAVGLFKTVVGEASS